MADAEGFQVVKKRKGQKNRKCREKNGSSSKSRNINTCFETNLCDVNELKTKIDKCSIDRCRCMCNSENIEDVKELNACSSHMGIVFLLDPRQYRNDSYKLWITILSITISSLSSLKLCMDIFLKDGLQMYQIIASLFIFVILTLTVNKYVSIEMFHDGRFVESFTGLVGSESRTMTSILKEPITDFVCYGIGKISSCPIARYQFALLLLLKELLQIMGLCFIFEPHFSEDEILVAKELGCSIIHHNEEGKRTVEHMTLFFMIHCGKPLYNSVLWANWGPGLANVIILGNKFSSYLERIPSRQLNEEAPYIYNILPYTTEKPIKNTFHHSDIFNDSAIHYFPSEMLTKVPLSMWEDHDEPKYDANDPEIITQS